MSTMCLIYYFHISIDQKKGKSTNHKPWLTAHTIQNGQYHHSQFAMQFTALQIYECNRERRKKYQTGKKTQILIVCMNYSQATLYSFTLFGLLHFGIFIYISAKKRFFVWCEFLWLDRNCMRSGVYVVHWFSVKFQSIFVWKLAYIWNHCNMQSIFTLCILPCLSLPIHLLYIYYWICRRFCWSCNYRSIAIWMNVSLSLFCLFV